AGLLWVDQDVVGREAHKSISSQPVSQDETVGDAVGDVLGLIGLQAESGGADFSPYIARFSLR
ncbi:hypothetical protein NGM37_42905, partial [Streptomyces sp. TRM76130]|nr:hypothetical protein [Streptomyces sp. TRM76130]